jgi:O-antigen/teichoic acid export membrane protein
MMAATLMSGIAMFAVHIFAPRLGADYGAFGTLLGILHVMMIPALALQTVFAQQTASAISAEEKARLTGTVQALLLGTLLLWLGMAGGVLLFEREILSLLAISNPAALWITVTIGLGQFWVPILLGVLQGRQNFLWLGLIAIINGVGRFAAIAVIVLILGGLVTGAMAGALIGILAALILAIVHSRSIWMGPRLPFDWKNWLGLVIPLTLGLGSSQFLFSFDVIVVRAVFGTEHNHYYVAAGMIGRGLVMFTLPLTVVMFPKIVHSISLGKKTNVLVYTLFGTALLGGFGALASTGIALAMRQIVLYPEQAAAFVPARLIDFLEFYAQGALVISELIPWFVWCMLPLALSNVLLNNLMAAKRFRIVPLLLIIAAGYAAALVTWGNSFIRVVQLLGIFNLSFLGVLAAYTWWDANPKIRSHSVTGAE